MSLPPALQRVVVVAALVLVVLAGRRLIPAGMGIVPRLILLIALVIGALTAISWLLRRFGTR